MTDIRPAAMVPELACTDYRVSFDFYTKVLGFHALYTREEHGFAYLEREGGQLMIDGLPSSGYEGSAWLTAPLEQPFGRGINLSIETTDVNAVYAAVQAAGAEIYLPLEDVWYRQNVREIGKRQFIVCDPDGYMLRFGQTLGFRGVADE